MVVKVYISGISGNKEVKKRQQRVTMILDSRSIGYEVVDITEPGKESDRDFMQTNSTSLGITVSDTNPRHPLPPQIFNGELYCGDYEQFDLANEIDELEKFLKMSSTIEAKAVSEPVEIETEVTNETDNVEEVEEVEEVGVVEEEKVEDDAEVEPVENDEVTLDNGTIESNELPAEMEADVAA